MASNVKSFKRLLIIYCLVVAYGFPGSLGTLLSGSITTLIEYSAFFIEIFLVFFNEDRIENVMDIKVVNLKKRYFTIYFMLIVFFAESMLVTNYPKEEVISCLRFSVTAAFGMWLVDHFDIEELLTLLYEGQSVFVMITVATWLVRPDLCYSYEFMGLPSFSGLYDRKNAGSAELSVGIVLQVALYKVRKTRKKPVSLMFLGMFLIQMFMLVISRATGALLSTLATSAYIMMLHKKSKKLPLGLIYVVVSVGFLVFALSILPLFKPILEALGKDVTLTNRTPMWVEHIDIMLHTHTFTGFGFNMFWRDPSAVALFHNRFKSESWFANMSSGAHNTILELWLNVGLIGLAAYLSMFLISFWNIRKLSEEQYTICSAIIILYTIRGLTERSFTTSNYQSILLFVCIAVAGSVPLLTEKTDNAFRPQERTQATF